MPFTNEKDRKRNTPVRGKGDSSLEKKDNDSCDQIREGLPTDRKS